MRIEPGADGKKGGKKQKMGLKWWEPLQGEKNLWKGIEHVVIGGNAGNGYTTCMWHNLLTCQILYDSNGRLLAEKKRFQLPYPEHLKKNIITNNMNLCKLLPDCFEENLEKLFHEMYQGDVCEVIAEIVSELNKLIEIG